MHLLVLSAFRHTMSYVENDAQLGSQCTFWCSVLSDWITMAFGLQELQRVSMHLLVLSAFRRGRRPLATPCGRSQCTFWCSVLSDWRMVTPAHPRSPVSMHLLVLSAFRRDALRLRVNRFLSQCTFWCSVLSDSIVCLVMLILILSLNAPFGAQCFPTGVGETMG